jgi:hypothetical protein
LCAFQRRDRERRKIHISLSSGFLNPALGKCGWGNPSQRYHCLCLGRGSVETKNVLGLSLSQPSWGSKTCLGLQSTERIRRDRDSWNSFIFVLDLSLMQREGDWQPPFCWMRRRPKTVKFKLMNISLSFGLSLSWREGQVIFCQRSVRSRNTKASVSGDWDLRHRDRKKNNHQSQPETAWVETLTGRLRPVWVSKQGILISVNSLLLRQTATVFGVPENQKKWCGPGIRKEWLVLGRNLLQK